MTQVEILWYTGTGFFSWCIKAGQTANWAIRRLMGKTSERRHASFTHVAIRIDDNLYEALTPQIVVHRGEDCHARRAQAAASTLIPMNGGLHLAAEEFLEDQVNDGYGFLEILFVALDQLFPYLPVTLAASADRTFICSALVAFAGMIIGLDHALNTHSPYLQTPASLANIFTPVPLGNAAV